MKGLAPTADLGSPFSSTRGCVHMEISDHSAIEASDSICSSYRLAVPAIGARQRGDERFERPTVFIHVKCWDMLTTRATDDHGAHDALFAQNASRVGSKHAVVAAMIACYFYTLEQRFCWRLSAPSSTGSGLQQKKFNGKTTWCPST